MDLNIIPTVDQVDSAQVFKDLFRKDLSIFEWIWDIVIGLNLPEDIKCKRVAERILKDYPPIRDEKNLADFAKWEKHRVELLAVAYYKLGIIHDSPEYRDISDRLVHEQPKMRIIKQLLSIRKEFPELAKIGIDSINAEDVFLMTDSEIEKAKDALSELCKQMSPMTWEALKEMRLLILSNDIQKVVELLDDQAARDKYLNLRLKSIKSELTREDQARFEDLKTMVKNLEEQDDLQTVFTLKEESLNKENDNRIVSKVYSLDDELVESFNKKHLFSCLARRNAKIESELRSQLKHITSLRHADHDQIDLAEKLNNRLREIRGYKKEVEGHERRLMIQRAQANLQYHFDGFLLDFPEFSNLGIGFLPEHEASVKKMNLEQVIDALEGLNDLEEIFKSVPGNPSYYLNENSDEKRYFQHALRDISLAKSWLVERLYLISREAKAAARAEPLLNKLLSNSNEGGEGLFEEPKSLARPQTKDLWREEFKPYPLDVSFKGFYTF